MLSECLTKCLLLLFLPPRMLWNSCFFFLIFFFRPLFGSWGPSFSYCWFFLVLHDKIISLPERRFYLNIWMALVCVAFQSEFSWWCMKGNRYVQFLITGWASHFGLVSQFSVVQLIQERTSCSMASLPSALGDREFLIFYVREPVHSGLTDFHFHGAKGYVGYRKSKKEKG